MPRHASLVVGFCLAALPWLTACSGDTAGPANPPPPSCGNGVVDTGEQCDFGPANGPGTGCETTCQFSCTTAPDSCADANVCSGAGTCTPVTVSGHAGQKCAAGTPASAGTPCGTGLICNGDPTTCVASVCGDGIVDTTMGETCEPPGTGTCGANCVLVGCGNDALDAGEQCDDANGTPVSLDGCDTSCRYEMFVRMTSLQISNAQAFAACSPSTNVFGTQVFGALAEAQLNTGLAQDISSGKTNVLVQVLGADDLTGTADSSIELGMLGASPDPTFTWPAAGNPLDGRFILDSSGLDANDRPLTLFTSASIAARQLTAGPTDLTMSLGAAMTGLQLRGAHLAASVDDPPAPSQPSMPTLLSGPVFETVSGNGTGQGLCGNITVESLASVPVPLELTTGQGACMASCTDSHAYTYCGLDQPVGASCNSLLDVMIGGCKVSALCVPLVIPTQPDVAGDGYQGVLAVSGTNNKVPDSDTAGNTRAYSSYFTFRANRAHATGKAP